ncbi:MAG: envelope stress response membrane protein PspC [Pseudomonadota bacterium]
MSASTSIPDRRFYRNRDRGMIGGVCAGLADYFGFNLCITRVLAVIALFWAMPLTLIAYFGVVLLVPSKSLAGAEPPVDREFAQALRSSPGQTMSDLRSRFQSLDRRLARLEKYVTSQRFQLDREFRDLADRPEGGRTE